MVGSAGGRRGARVAEVEVVEGGGGNAVWLWGGLFAAWAGGRGGGQTSFGLALVLLH